MSRSNYVYVVLDLNRPVAGFTVKHELKTWLGNYYVPTMKIFRIRDHGPTQNPLEIDVTEILINTVNQNRNRSE